MTERDYWYWQGAMPGRTWKNLETLKLMDCSGMKCPKGHEAIELLSTTNEKCYYCRECDKRYRSEEVKQ